MATRAQIAAAKRNIRKAQAARKKLASPRRRAKRNDNPTRRAAARRTRRPARRAGATRRTTRRRDSNPVEILEANPVRRARRRRRPIATKKRTVYVRRSKPRRGKRQSIINVHVLDRKKRRAAPRRRRAAATRRRATTRRRPRRAAPRIAGLLPPARMANPAYGYDENPAYEANPTRRRKPRRKPKRKAARRRRSGVTQSIRVRRSTRAIHLYRNPMTGAMALGDNPVSYGYDDNPLGGMDDNPWSAPLSYGDNPRGMGRRHGMGMNPGSWSAPLNYDDNPSDMLDNPAYDDNPDDGGAFGMANIKKFGVAAGGVALGLIVADFVDRYVSTRKPKDAGELKAFGPWYGRDAAAAYRQKPDAMRLGVQALGAGGSMFLAYKLRNKSWAPWLFGGLAIGFGANLVKMLADWYLMPMVLKVDEKNSGKASLANRLYPLEQGYVQEKVQSLFKDWSTTPDLAQAQAETPVIMGPLSSGAAESGIYTLGDPNAQPRVENQLGRPLVPTGRVGTCGSCGGQNGCFSGCPTSCPGNCPQGVMPGQDSALPKCMYTVDERVNLMAVATEVGVNVNEIMALNSYADASILQMVGAEVILPNKLCAALELMEKGAAAEQAQRTSTTQGAPSNVERMMQPSMELVAPSGVTSTLAAIPEPAPISTIVAAPEPPASVVSTVGSTSSIGSSRSKLRGDAFLRTLGDADDTGSDQ
jgi:hypothetical protein